MKKPKLKDGELHGDGYLEPLADAIEAHPEFVDEYLDHTERYIKKTNPGLHAIMQRVKGAHHEKPA